MKPQSERPIYECDKLDQGTASKLLINLFGSTLYEVMIMPKQKKEEKQSSSRSIMQQAEMNVSVPAELLKRAEKEVKNMDYITPFSLAQKLSISMSTSRKLLKMLEQSKAVEAVSKNRRSPVFIAKKTE